MRSYKERSSSKRTLTLRVQEGQDLTTFNRNSRCNRIFWKSCQIYYLCILAASKNNSQSNLPSSRPSLSRFIRAGQDLTTFNCNSYHNRILVKSCSNLLPLTTDNRQQTTDSTSQKSTDNCLWFFCALQFS
jgi:hypothetical protein